MNLIERAELFARAAHGAIDQRRKYDGSAYINHPAEVASILLRFATGPVAEEQVAAAWLHDVVEDTKITLDDIRDCFGEEVESLVEALTDVSRPEDGNRRVRKQKDLDHTAAASPLAKSIKLADLISNSRSIVQHDPDFARVYLHEKTRILEVCSDADPGLLAEAYRVLNESRELLRKD
jgi:(p)ppGpp synthase/HD superfamily hydrolase